MARPTNLTLQLTNDLCDLLAEGVHREPACRSIGLPPSTFYRWMVRGADEEAGIYRDFRHAVEEAEAAAEIRAVSIIHGAALEDWRAALVFLASALQVRGQQRDDKSVAVLNGVRPVGARLRNLNRVRPIARPTRVQP